MSEQHKTNNRATHKCKLCGKSGYRSWDITGEIHKEKIFEINHEERCPVDSWHDWQETAIAYEGDMRADGYVCKNCGVDGISYGIFIQQHWEPSENILPVKEGPCLKFPEEVKAQHVWENK